MKSILRISVLVIFGFIIFACSKENSALKPVKVEVKQIEGTYHLFRGGKPFYIKGAGGSSRISDLARHGANSLRTWNTRNAQAILDSAQLHGITVLMGLHVERERHGFDYNDDAAVKQQLERLKKDIEKYKDHPALLGWGIGNELNLRYTNKKVWNAVNDIAKMVHDVDGSHPAATMLAGIGKDEIDYIKKHCTELDFLCIQIYADVINIRQRVAEAGWEGAYAITEWGATGHWEVPRTEWDAAIEQTSSERAELMKERYEKAIKADTTQCLGSYVFLWGQKQERTPTWYGLFLESGEEMESIDVMHYLWTGSWPQNRVPQIFDVTLQGKTRYDNIRLNSDQQVSLKFCSNDFENDALKIDAEILLESTDLGDGGDYELRPQTLAGLIIKESVNEVIFKTPKESGAYRIFVYIRNGHNNAATANVPFYVK